MGFAPDSRRVRAAAPPLRSPCRFRGRGKVRDPSLPAPYCTLMPPFAPCPPFVREQGSRRSHAGAGPPPYSPPLCSPCHLRGRRKVHDPSFCPCPLLHADPPPPPFCALPPVCSRANRVRADAGAWPSPLAPAQPPPFVGAWEGMCLCPLATRQ
jgi:hypothetical protein